MKALRKLLAPLLAACALCLAPSPALALEAKEGLVKIHVNESNARVSLYKLVDIARGRYESFLFGQEATTSFATLGIDGKQVKLGDAFDYRFTARRSETGVVLEFRSSFCVVRESVDFAKSEGAALADGVRIGFEIENVSERDEVVGLRYLLDTFLAEKSGIHFATDKAEKLPVETELLPGGGETWIATPGEKLGFMVQLAGRGVDRPDRVLLANWKRLSEAPWGFEANGQRNFTLVPYSINDSAAALYWEPESLPRGGTRKIGFALGSFSEKGYSAPEAASVTEQLFGATVLEGQPADPRTALAADLVAVRDLLTRIDRAIETGDAKPEEIAAWKSILERLEARKKGY